MFGIGIFELLVIFIVILLCVGPDKLPEFARNMAKYLGEFRKVSDDLKRSVMSAGDGLEIKSPLGTVLKRLPSISDESSTKKSTIAAPIEDKNGQ